MELIGGSSSRGSRDASKEKLTDEKEEFVNHAETAWYQMRAEWVGDQSKKILRPPKDSAMSHTANFDDMLLSKELFQRPIPLAVMVSYFAKIWHEEALYH